jgi:hypothetical protein
MPYTLKYPEHLRTVYYQGKIVPQQNHSQSHITILPEGGYRCTCGNVLRFINGHYMHKRTISHLQRTGQIDVRQPGSLKEQRDRLIDGGVGIW